MTQIAPDALASKHAPEGLDIEVSWGGSTDSRSGAITLKFIAPMSEVRKWIQLSFYTKKQCFLTGRWHSSDNGAPIVREEQFATCMYAGKSEDEDGEAVIRFKTDVNSVDAEMLNTLKQDCAEDITGTGKTFILNITTADDIAARLVTP